MYAAVQRAGDRPTLSVSVRGLYPRTFLPKDRLSIHRQLWLAHCLSLNYIPHFVSYCELPGVLVAIYTVRDVTLQFKCIYRTWPQMIPRVRARLFCGKPAFVETYDFVCPALVLLLTPFHRPRELFVWQKELHQSLYSNHVFFIINAKEGAAHCSIWFTFIHFV